MGLGAAVVRLIVPYQGSAGRRHDLAHAKFGGSSLLAGRARATKATAGLRGLQQFTLAISH